MYDIHSSILENFMGLDSSCRRVLLCELPTVLLTVLVQYCDEAGCTRTTSVLVLSCTVQSGVGFRRIFTYGNTGRKEYRTSLTDTVQAHTPRRDRLSSQPSTSTSTRRKRRNEVPKARISLCRYHFSCFVVIP